jgi:hypothetical protein
LYASVNIEFRWHGSDGYDCHLSLGFVGLSDMPKRDGVIENLNPRCPVAPFKSQRYAKNLEECVMKHIRCVHDLALYRDMPFGSMKRLFPDLSLSEDLIAGPCHDEIRT